MAIGRPINSNGPLGIRTVGFTATAGQTEFTVPGGYTINKIDVFRNGVKLTQQSDYQATDEIKVVLSTAAQLNDEVTIKVYSKFDVANAIVGAASSQTINGDLTITGTLYQPNATPVGAAGTWANYDGLAGVTTSKKVQIVNDLHVTGVGTFGSLVSGTITGTTGSFDDVSIGGTLTYEDVTNVDSVGLVTARSGLRIGTGGTVGPVGSGIVTYFGDGSNLTGIDSLKDSGGNVKAQANSNGVVVTGVLTATNVSTSSSVTAATFYGDGSNLQGVGDVAGTTLQIWLYGGG